MNQKTLMGQNRSTKCCEHLIQLLKFGTKRSAYEKKLSCWKMRNFFISIDFFIRKFLIKFLITKHCGDSVVTGGEGATKNNCFWIGLLSNNNSYLLIESYLNEKLNCSKFENNKYIGKVSIKENELIKYDIEFTHHFRGYQIHFIGII